MFNHLKKLNKHCKTSKLAKLQVVQIAYANNCKNVISVKILRKLTTQYCKLNKVNHFKAKVIKL